jgi:hypothetical protein
MRRLTAVAAVAVLSALVALPGVAQANNTPTPSPTVSSGSPTSTPTATPTPTSTPTGTPTTTPTKTPTPKPTPTHTKTPPPKKKPPKKKHKKPVPLPGTTVTGPHMYVPGTGVPGVKVKYYKTASTVTVSQTTNLVNQMIKVSWTGFTPSSQPTYDNVATDYPVEVVECRGWNPQTPEDCYGADNGGSPSVFGKYGPGNASYGTSNADGSGAADILLFTQVQNQFLECGPTVHCSIVVVDSQGGDSFDFAKPHCGNHSVDTAALGGTDLGQYAFSPITSAAFTANGYCSWQQRIVIPLHFAPTPSGCPLRQADFSAGGSPMLSEAMQQWQTGICFGANAIELQYNGSLNESEARSYFQAGTTDVAFTTEPLSGSAAHPFTYAPVAVSAVSVGYWVDNVNTGQPETGVKLDPRLLVKMLTTSYSSSDACPNGGNATFGCDSAVEKNPANLYSDPEFRKLNPKFWQNAAQPTGLEIPIVVSGTSDITVQTTTWLGSDKDAASFLAGQFDPWGMHVNTDYLGLKYPITGFLPMDPYFPVSTQYAPVYPMSTVASDMALNQEPGTQDVKDPITGNYDSLQPEINGNRDMWALVSEADAARFLFPVAGLENAAGVYVRPTVASMTAAVNDMTVNPDKITRAMNYTKKDKAAYPLTMVIYAMVPTGGLSKAKAAAIAGFLDYVANQGQVPGSSPGQLAPGYLPLPQVLRDQTLKAASEVLNQTGNPKPKPKPTASATTSASPTPTSASPTPSKTASSIVVSFSHPDAIGVSWLVLALLITGAVLLAAGPAALLYGSPGARAAIGSGSRRLWQARSALRNRPPTSRPGGRPGRVWHRRGAVRPPWRRN